MERYGDDAQRRMRTEDHVPSGRAGFGRGGQPGQIYRLNDAAVSGLLINLSFCTAREMDSLFIYGHLP